MSKLYQARPLAITSLHDKGITRGRADTLNHYVGEELVIPAFDVESDWLGASYVVKQFNYVSDEVFTLTDYPLDNNNVDLFENCCIVLAWRVNGKKRRYKLNWNVNEWVPACLYAGETIPLNFTIEVWNTPGTRARLQTAFNLMTTLWRNRLISEVDSALVDEQDPTWTGEYEDLESIVNLALPLNFDTNVQHLNN